MNASELARYLGRGRDFATGLMEDGVLPVIWHRNRRYVPRLAVEQWLTGGAEVPEPAPIRAFPRKVRRAA